MYQVTKDVERHEMTLYWYGSFARTRAIWSTEYIPPATTEVVVEYTLRRKDKTRCNISKATCTGMPDFLSDVLNSHGEAKCSRELKPLRDALRSKFTQETGLTPQSQGPELEIVGHGHY